MPLYLMMGLGFVAARFLGAQKETAAPILIYIVTSAVVFYGAAAANLNRAALALPIFSGDFLLAMVWGKI